MLILILKAYSGLSLRTYTLVFLVLPDVFLWCHLSVGSTQIEQSFISAANASTSSSILHTQHRTEITQNSNSNNKARAHPVSYLPTYLRVFSKPHFRKFAHACSFILRPERQMIGENDRFFQSPVSSLTHTRFQIRCHTPSSDNTPTCPSTNLTVSPQKTHPSPNTTPPLPYSHPTQSNPIYLSHDQELNNQYQISHSPHLIQ